MGEQLLMPWGELDEDAAPEARPAAPPAWYTPSKDRKRANLLVLQGRHPLGEELGPVDATCGSCVHLRRKQFSKTYLKCGVGPDSGGPATDVRKKWRGCAKWEPHETRTQ